MIVKKKNKILPYTVVMYRYGSSDPRVKYCAYQLYSYELMFFLLIRMRITPRMLSVLQMLRNRILHHQSLHGPAGT